MAETDHKEDRIDMAVLTARDHFFQAITTAPPSIGHRQKSVKNATSFPVCGGGGLSSCTDSILAAGHSEYFLQCHCVKPR